MIPSNTAVAVQAGGGGPVFLAVSGVAIPATVPPTSATDITVTFENTASVDIANNPTLLIGASAHVFPSDAGSPYVDSLGGNWTCTNLPSNDMSCSRDQDLGGFQQAIFTFPATTGNPGALPAPELLSLEGGCSNCAPGTPSSVSVTIDSPPPNATMTVDIAPLPGLLEQGQPFSVAVDVSATDNDVVDPIVNLQPTNEIALQPGNYASGGGGGTWFCTGSGTPGSTLNCVFDTGVTPPIAIIQGNSEPFTVPALVNLPTSAAPVFNQGVASLAACSNGCSIVDDMEENSTIGGPNLTANVAGPTTATANEVVATTLSFASLVGTNNTDASNIAVDVCLGNANLASAIPAGPPFNCTATTPGVCTEAYACTFAVSPLMPGQSIPDLNLDVQVSGMAGTSTVEAAITSIEQDLDDNDNGDMLSISVGGAADLMVAKLFDYSGPNADPVPGETFSFQIDVSNQGPNTATNIQVVDVLPTGHTLNNFAPVSEWSCAVGGQTVTCDYVGGAATIAPAGSAPTLTLNVAGDTSGVYDNQACATATEFDPMTPSCGNSGNYTIAAVTDLALQFNPNTYSVQEATQVTLQLEIENVAITGVDPGGFDVVIAYPAALINPNSTSTNFNCVDATPAPGNLSCTFLGAIPPSTVVPLAVTMDAVTPVTNAVLSATLQNIGVPDTEASNDSSSATITVLAIGGNEADLRILKTAETGGTPLTQVAVGDPFEYRLNVTNFGPDPATGFTIFDNLPPEVSLATNPFNAPAGFSCSEPSPGTVACDFAGSLANGASADIILSVMADQAATFVPNSVFTGNELELNPDVGTGGQANSDSATIEIQSLGGGQTEVLVDVMSSQPTINLGGTTTIDLRVDNLGPDAVTTAQLQIALDPELSYVSDTGNFTCVPQTPVPGNPQLIDCDFVNSMFRGTPIESFVQSIDVQGVAVTSPTANVVVDIVSVSGSNDPVDDSDTVAVTVLAGAQQADMSLVKRAVSAGNAARGPNATFQLGEFFVFEFDVQNIGPDDAFNVQVADVLPTQVAFVGSLSPNWSCVSQGDPRDIVCTHVGVFPASGFSLLEMEVQAVATGNATNVATVSSDATDPNPNNDDGSVSFGVISVESDLAIAASAQPSSIEVAETTTVTIDVDNFGPNDAPDPSVQIDVPNVLRVDSATAANFNCQVGRPTICSWQGPALAANNQSVIELEVTGLAASETGLQVTVAPGFNSDSNPNNNQAIADIFVTSGTGTTTDVEVRKTTAGGVRRIGEQIDYDIRVTNVGDQAVAAVRVSDRVPSGQEFVALVAPGFDCIQGRNVVCDFESTLLPDESASITLTTRAPRFIGTSTNTASIEVPGDINEDNNSDDARLNIVAADLVVRKTSSARQVAQGDSLRFIVDVRNEGNITAPNVVVRDDFPTGLQPQSAAGTGWACSLVGQQVECTYGAGLTPNEQAPSIELIAIAETTGNYTNIARAASDEVELDSTNNEGSAAVQVGVDAEAPVDLVLALSNSVGTVAPGAAWALTAEVSNAGRETATGVVLTIELPANAGYIGTQSTGWSCAPPDGGRNVVCDLAADLAAGAAAPPVRVDLIASDTPGSMQSRATVMADQRDANNGNNSDTLSTTVSETGTGVPPDVTITGLFSPPSIDSGGQTTLDFTIENVGEGAATVVDLGVLLPPGLTAVATPPAPWSCTDTDEGLFCQYLAGLSGGGAVSDLFRFEASVPGDYEVQLSVAAPNENNELNNRIIVPLTVTQNRATADLQLAISIAASSVSSGDAVALNLELANAGPQAAPDATVRFDLSAGLALDATSSTVCGVQGATVSCAFGALDSGQVRTQPLRLLTDGVQPGAIEISATTESTSTFDPDTTNNQATVAFDVVARSSANLVTDLQIGESIQVNQAAPFTLVVANAGEGDADALEVRLEVPAGVSLSNTVATGVSCTQSAAGLVCNRDSSLGAGAQVSVTGSAVFAIASNATQLVATAATSSPENDTTDNTDTATLSVVEFDPSLVGQQLNELLTDPVAAAMIDPLVGYCDRPGARSDLCGAIRDAANSGDGTELTDAFRALNGEETITQTSSLVEASTTLFQNIDARLSQLRGGGGGVSLGLSLAYGNETVPLGMISSILMAQDEAAAIESGGLVQPWGFFINGTISGGDRDPTTLEQGFDFDTRGITAGVDYRLSGDAVIGAALGYSNFDADLDADGGELETQGWSLSGYGSFYPTERWYLDGRISYGQIDFEQIRRVQFSLGDFAFDETAIGDTDASQWQAAISTGWQFNRAGYSLTPNASVRYMRADIDGFSETGLDDLNINYQDQSVDSLQIVAGFQASKAFSTKRGIFTPQFDINYHHETMNDDEFAVSFLPGAGANEFILNRQDSPDRNFGSAQLGLVFVSAGGKQAYFTYRQMLGLEDYTNWTINLGARFEF